MSERVYLVTGALGCIGAWTLFHLVKRGEKVVSFDLTTGGHRVNHLLSTEEQAHITFVKGDLVDSDAVLNVFKEQHITHVIHLAALQVPFCRQNPIKGAQVNVVGTVNLFEAARQVGITHLSQASSIAVYGPADLYPHELIPHHAPLAPTTLYGVYKQADEGIARVYWQDHRISSVGLRPYTVYGVGRDQGLTSDPTKAMLAVAMNQPFHINFGGVMQLQWASDVALQFIDAATRPLEGAQTFNLGGDPTNITTLVETIQTLRPNAQITIGEARLPFPSGFDDSPLRQYYPIYETPLLQGIEETLKTFETLVHAGQIQMS